jgi:membrane dipeptidase
MTSPVSPKTSKLLAESIVVDLTAPGSPMSLVTPSLETTDRWIREYEQAGVTWASFTVATDQTGGLEATIRTIAIARRWFLDRPERFVLVERADDIRRAKREKKLAVSFNFQGTVPVGTDLKLIEVYKRLGVEHMLMAYNARNFVGDGCHEPSDAGLSAFGATLVAEMNRVGMLVDVTHTGYRTAMDVIAVSQAPVIMSHSNPKALFEHDRNVPDEQIRAMAKTGGVMGIHGVGIFLSKDGLDISAETLARHVDYVVQMVGAQHVGFGLDYVENIPLLKAFAAAAGPGVYKQGAGYLNEQILFAPPAVIGPVADILLGRGYSDSDVRGILGENWLRVLGKVWG